MEKNIFIDTDAGLDDIIAICMLILSDKFTIRGISVVNGVASVKRGTTNIARLLNYLDKQIPIYSGINQQKQKSSKQFPSQDRKRVNQLSPLTIKLPARSQTIQDIKQITDVFERIKNPLPIFCVGPLSNIASLIKKDSIKGKIERLVIMGGSVFEKGNVKPSFQTEYNIRLDPQAAKTVFTSTIPKVLIPLDAVSYAPALLKNNTKEKPAFLLKNFLEWLRTFTLSTKAAKIIQDIILNNIDDFSYFYDPLAAAILINPNIVKKTVQGNSIVSTSKRTFGKLSFYQKKGSNTKIVMSIDSSKFYKLLKTLLQKTPPQK